MLPKLRELLRDIESAGFINRGTRDDFYILRHPDGVNITLGGNPNQDAKQYQVQDVKRAIELVTNKDE